MSEDTYDGMNPADNPNGSTARPDVEGETCGEASSRAVEFATSHVVRIEDAEGDTLTCSACSSPETRFIESRADDQVVGGKVHLWACDICGEVTEDVPPEKYDEARDRKLVKEAEQCHTRPRTRKQHRQVQQGKAADR